MPNVRGCNLPEDRLYDVDNHTWFTEEGDGTVKIWPLAGEAPPPGRVLFEEKSTLTRGLARSPIFSALYPRSWMK